MRANTPIASGSRGTSPNGQSHRSSKSHRLGGIPWWRVCFRAPHVFIPPPPPGQVPSIASQKVWVRVPSSPPRNKTFHAGFLLAIPAGVLRTEECAQPTGVEAPREHSCSLHAPSFLFLLKVLQFKARAHTHPGPGQPGARRRTRPRCTWAYVRGRICVCAHARVAVPRGRASPSPRWWRPWRRLAGLSGEAHEGFH